MKVWYALVEHTKDRSRSKWFIDEKKDNKYKF